MSGTPPHPARPYLIRLILIALMLSLGLILASLGEPDLRQDYDAACAWWSGLPSAMSDLSACPAGAGAKGVAFTAHPPFATWVVLPLALMPWPLADHVWIVLSVLMIALAWHLTDLPLAACAASALPWTYALSRGALEPLIFLLFSIIVRIQHGRPYTAAALIGVSAAFKVYPLLLLAPLIARRRFDALAIAVAAGVSAVLIAEITLGIGVTWAWIRFTPDNMDTWVANPDNISLVRPLWLMLDGVSPSLIALLVYAALTLGLGRRLSRADGVQAMLPVMLLSTPLTWSHYIGHVTLTPLARREVLLLALGSGLLLLSLLRLMPYGAILYLPFQAALLLAWYRGRIWGAAV